MTEVTRRRLTGRLRADGADLLVGLVCVVLAGGLVSWAGDRGNHAEVAAGLDEQAPLSRSGQSVEVGDRLVARAVTRTSGGTPVTTADRFLAVRIALRTPGERVETSISCTLRQGGAEVRPVFTSALPMPESGMQTVVDLAFERPVDGLVGAQLACKPFEQIRAWSRVLVFDLGVDQAHVDEWDRTVTRPVPLELNGETEVIR